MSAGNPAGQLDCSDFNRSSHLTIHPTKISLDSINKSAFFACKEAQGTRTGSNCSQLLSKTTEEDLEEDATVRCEQKLA